MDNLPGTRLCQRCMGPLFLEQDTIGGVAHANEFVCWQYIVGRQIKMEQEIQRLKVENAQAHQNLRAMANAAAYGV